MIVNLKDERSMVANFISWQRLAEELFREGGEIKPGEYITKFDVTSSGIRYFIGQQP